MRRSARPTAAFTGPWAAAPTITPVSATWVSDRPRPVTPPRTPHTLYIQYPLLELQESVRPATVAPAAQRRLQTPHQSRRVQPTGSAPFPCAYLRWPKVRLDPRARLIML